ncbi:hypothetical protein F9802_06270 [Bacillus aerolatus]|uniref:Transporter n=1 Tax=Bacillus aerolatus TaxID=2653354 RepID=A0A6I1FGP8_9BACI|nr:hypothetical protein [Bacillus aerolatus]KAB7707355.1 hypothetical protein F9802_06270 [Bacillus aerolatus]
MDYREYPYHFPFLPDEEWQAFEDEEWRAFENEAFPDFPLDQQQGFPGEFGSPGQQSGFPEGFGLPRQQPGFPGGFGPPGQQPGFPGGFGPPGQLPGFPGGFGPPGQQQGGAPTSPPPSFTPQLQQQSASLFAVDPGAIRGCLYRYTYVWLENGRSFWFYPIFVGRNSVSGWRWRNRRWVYYGTDLRTIRSFQCF